MKVYLGIALGAVAASATWVHAGPRPPSLGMVDGRWLEATPEPVHADDIVAACQVRGVSVRLDRQAETLTLDHGPAGRVVARVVDVGRDSATLKFVNSAGGSDTTILLVESASELRLFPLKHRRVHSRTETRTPRGKTAQDRYTLPHGTLYRCPQDQA